jgi:hypothetical protein
MEKERERSEDSDGEGAEEEPGKNEGLKEKLTMTNATKTRKI